MTTSQSAYINGMEIQSRQDSGETQRYPLFITVLGWIVRPIRTCNLCSRRLTEQVPFITTSRAPLMIPMTWSILSLFFPMETNGNNLLPLKTWCYKKNNVIDEQNSRGFLWRTILTRSSFSVCGMVTGCRSMSSIWGLEAVLDGKIEEITNSETECSLPPIRPRSQLMLPTGNWNEWFANIIGIKTGYGICVPDVSVVGSYALWWTVLSFEGR